MTKKTPHFKAPPSESMRVEPDYELLSIVDEVWRERESVERARSPGGGHHFEDWRVYYLPPPRGTQLNIPLMRPRSAIAPEQLNDFADQLSRALTEVATQWQNWLALRNVEAQGLRLRRLSQEVKALPQIKAELASLRKAVYALRKQLADQEEPVYATYTQEADIAWERVHSALERAADNLGWKVEFKAMPAENTVRVVVPDSQIDLVGDTTRDFYRLCAEALDPSTFKALQFDFS